MLPGSHGHHLALIVLCVPHSLGVGGLGGVERDGGEGGFTGTRESQRERDT